jgi:hypothetical protein
MSTRTFSALAATYSALRRFLRETWISRVNLADWLKSWTLKPSKRRRQEDTKPKRVKQLEIESFEVRGGPDDILAILQSGWLGPGGMLLTPGLVLLRGWNFGQVVDEPARLAAPVDLRLSETIAVAPAPDAGPEPIFVGIRSAEELAAPTRPLPSISEEPAATNPRLVTFLPPSNSTSCDSPTFRSTARISGVRVGFGGSAGSSRGNQDKAKTARGSRLFMSAFLNEGLFVVFQSVVDASLLRRGPGHNRLSD